MKHYVCPKCGRKRHPLGRKCPDCEYIGRPKAVKGQVLVSNNPVANPTVPYISATPQQTAVPATTVPAQGQAVPTVIVLDRGETKKAESEGLTALQTLLLVGILLVGAAIWYIWRNPSLLSQIPDFKLPAFISTVEGVTGQEPTINPQPKYDSEGKITGCAEGGSFIEFVGGNPNFLDEKGAVKPELLPKVAEQATWYCFDPEAWKKWLELPVPGKDYSNVEALTMAIMKASGLNSQAWKDAIASALQASIGQDVLVLPAKTKQEQVSDLTQPQVYNQPTVGSSAGDESSGGREISTPFQPAEPTDTPMPTLAVADIPTLVYVTPFPEVATAIPTESRSDAVATAKAEAKQQTCVSFQSATMFWKLDDLPIWNNIEYLEFRWGEDGLYALSDYVGGSGPDAFKRKVCVVQILDAPSNDLDFGGGITGTWNWAQVRVNPLYGQGDGTTNGEECFMKGLWLFSCSAEYPEDKPTPTPEPLPTSTPFADYGALGHYIEGYWGSNPQFYYAESCPGTWNGTVVTIAIGNCYNGIMHRVDIADVWDVLDTNVGEIYVGDCGTPMLDDKKVMQYKSTGVCFGPVK